ncbi:TonB-dependent receptor [Prevotella sp. 10(H)]|uniref:TonB-dependent receptor n=1 Tax=Prevotella sp. 10(H) TaxID=1158294 RepID=UPI0009DDE8B0|nr:TonB-dependent receptor [Prevotella sp. 10(H)]
MNKKTNCIWRMFLICAMVLSCAALNAQGTKKIDVVLNQANFKNFLETIESKTDYRFIYDGVDIGSLPKVTVNYKNTEVQTILSTELPKYNINHQINGNQIVLIRKSASQQQDGPLTVKGVITDKAGNPIIGATVSLKNSSVGTMADVDGNYTLPIPAGTENPVLSFSLVGFVTVEENVNRRSTINMTMYEDDYLLSEVVVVGYGMVKKSDATGALDVIKSKDFNNGIVSSPEMLLNGHVAGVQITPGSGQPGANTSVRIRGVNSISASSEPLYVIDGVPIDNTRTATSVSGDAALSNMPLNPLSMIAAADIESMTILKDASATAIYGSRGANGVIIITTKGGKDGVLSLNYSSTIGIANVSKKLDVLSADEFRQYVPSANKGVSTDWQDEIFRTAFTQDHNVTFSNGTKNTSYRASVSMSDQPGTILETGLRRYSLRLNAIHKMFDERLVLSVNASNTRYELNNFLEQQSSGASGGMINNALKGDPTQPVHNSDGSYNEYSEENFRNPVALAKQITDKTVGDRFIGNIDAEFFFIPKELSIKANIGYDVDNSERKAYQPRTSIITKNIQGRSVIDNNRYASFLSETYGTYNKVFEEKHALNVVAGYSWQEFESSLLSAVGEGYTTDLLGANNLEGARSLVRRSTNKEINRLISFYGRVNYSLNNKYMLTATVRRDGSSRFGANNKWGVFPSAAVAWKIKEENFMKDVNFVSDLKLRAGFGITGNQDIGNFRYDKTYNVNSLKGAMWNQQQITAYEISGISNPDLKWEETSQFNIGLDYGILGNRFRGAIDFYRKTTSNLLLEVDAIQPAVASKFLDNVGEMTNTGIEFSINANIIDTKDFSWNSSFNIAYNKNNVTKLNNDRDIYYGSVSGKGATGNLQILRVGEAFGTFYGKKFKGLKEVTNGDGSKGYVEEFEDGEHIIGNALPDVTLGLTNSFQYKNFDMSFVLRSSLGADVYNNTRAELENSRLPNMNTNLSGADFYQKGGTGITYTSSRWIENASFLRLDNMTIGYKLDILPSVFKSARIFATAQNLFVITSYSGYDPEVNNRTVSGGINSTGVDYCSYPQSRTFLFGLNLNF